MHHGKRFRGMLGMLALLLPLLSLFLLIVAGCGGGGSPSGTTHNPGPSIARAAPTLTEMANGSWQGQGSYGVPLSDSIPPGMVSGGFAFKMDDRSWTIRLNAAPDGAFTATIRDVNTGEEGTISGTLPAVRGDTDGTTWGEPASYAFAYVPYIIYAEIPDMPLVLSSGNYSVKGNFRITDYTGAAVTESGEVNQLTHKQMQLELTAYFQGATPVKEAFLLVFSLSQAK